MEGARPMNAASPEGAEAGRRVSGEGGNFIIPQVRDFPHSRSNDRNWVEIRLTFQSGAFALTAPSASSQTR
jgi:hypothetical protein